METQIKDYRKAGQFLKDIKKYLNSEKYQRFEKTRRISLLNSKIDLYNYLQRDYTKKYNNIPIQYIQDHQNDFLEVITRLENLYYDDRCRIKTNLNNFKPLI